MRDRRSFANASRTPDSLFRQDQEYVAHIPRLHKMSRGICGEDRLRSLNFGCGYGEFLQDCGLFGFDAYGVDETFAGIYPRATWTRKRTIASLRRFPTSCHV